MCGIIGIISSTPVSARLIESLKRLEYRGYDSAGIATREGHTIARRRAPGKIAALEAVLAADPLSGTIGIGHTRWATHGKPNEANAHPHAAGRVALVHNGIIENYAQLRTDLIAKGRAFESETDTEVVAHLIDAELELGRTPREAFFATLQKLHGAFSLAVIITGDEDVLLGARLGSPLVIGHGDHEMFLGSDALAVAPFTREITYLEEGDWCVLTRTGADVFDANGRSVTRAQKTVSAAAALVEKGNYRHFMQKEIFEAPEAVSRTLSAYVDAVAGHVALPGAVDFTSINRIQIVACGTAYYAGMVGKYLIERLSGLPVDLEIASEFRYRQPSVAADTLALAVSQSGETADTLAALKWCKAQGLKTAALVNVHESSMAREADMMWPTHAGPEIGVASTKAFAAQVAALTAIAVAAAHARGRIDDAQLGVLVQHLLEAPRLMIEALKVDGHVRSVAQDLLNARSVLYLGRGVMFPLMLEGALKLKELSYIHAEGFAAGELKHGPIALVDEHTPIVMLAPMDELFEKSASNLSEVVARGGRVVLISDTAGLAAAGDHSVARIEIPTCDTLIMPLVATPALHMLAYHVASLKGADVDQPRNLAKSVTVE
jgi:glucosamine--fructose-6-phosphate aminotransferase (isomerizing)